jgi:hypothetical protein
VGIICLLSVLGCSLLVVGRVSDKCYDFINS